MGAERRPFRECRLRVGSYVIPDMCGQLGAAECRSRISIQGANQGGRHEVDVFGMRTPQFDRYESDPFLKELSYSA